MLQNKRKLAAGAVIALLLIIIVIVLFRSNSVYTDNAYLKADITTIRPKVYGYITEVLINDNQQLKVGQVIAKIDDRDYKFKLNQAKVKVYAANTKINMLTYKLAIQDLEISKAIFHQDAAKVVLERADRDLKRAQDLIKNRTISQQDLEKIQEMQNSAKNLYQVATSSYKAAMVEKTVNEAELEEAKLLLKSYQDDLELAKIDLENTIIKATINGVVSKKALQVGQLASSSTALGYLVQNNIWVLANFKEVQIEKIKPGQQVIIIVDSFPNKKFKGKVDSISSATGAEFSILTPENATGNFTKIVQRVPVKIIFEPNQDLTELRSGLSCEVRIEIK